MTTEKVNDLEIVKLADYFDAGKFRLVPADVAYIPGGISEVPVNINIHPVFAKKLNFDTNNLQHFFAFAIMTKKLKEINEADYYSPVRQGKLKSVELNDCGELWIMKFEFFDETKKLYAVKAEEIPPLMNDCRKPVLLEHTGF